MDSQLVVKVGDSEADEQRLEEMSLALRRELLQLDVDDVEQLHAGQAPTGTRAFDVAAVGALLVTLTSSATAVAGVIDTVRGWLVRGSSARTVELSIGDKTLKLSGASDEQQERLIREFVSSVSGS